jgi:hypothetical protein
MKNVCASNSAPCSTAHAGGTRVCLAHHHHPPLLAKPRQSPCPNFHGHLSESQKAVQLPCRDVPRHGKRLLASETAGGDWGRQPGAGEERRVWPSKRMPPLPSLLPVGGSDRCRWRAHAWRLTTAGELDGRCASSDAQHAMGVDGWMDGWRAWMDDRYVCRACCASRKPSPNHVAPLVAALHGFPRLVCAVYGPAQLHSSPEKPARRRVPREPDHHQPPPPKREKEL